MEAREMKIMIAVALLSILLPGIASARDERPAPPESAAVREADALYQKKDWAGAARAFEALVKSDPANGRAWFRLGVSLQALGKLSEAVVAYGKAEAIGHNPVVMFNLATACSRLGDRDKALGWLEKAAEAGFAQPATLASDEDLAPLREEPRFKAVLKRVEAAAHPCPSIPEARQFDFWVGKWDVRTPAGDPAGTNTIELILGQCALMENWTGLGGGTGRSVNFYDRVKGKWRQTWVDDHGDAVDFVDGEYQDSVMRFRAETLGRDGGKILRRLSFFNLGPDKVRQFSEQSTDDGKTWTTEYDFTYNRMK
jgi:tetratricopeptide (TPR) repeat protein